MRQTRKQTAWRKSRKFGDIHGGRMRPRLTDGIVNRAHPFRAPAAGAELPILIEENPSRDRFWPIDGAAALAALRALPSSETIGITHLWLRRSTASTRRAGEPLASFACGSGVRLITLYPWRRDRRMCLGRQRPQKRWITETERFGAETIRERGWWYTAFDLDGLRRFVVERLLYHEVGHHIELCTKRWSGRCPKKGEDFADQYAAHFSATAAGVVLSIDESE